MTENNSAVTYSCSVRDSPQGGGPLWKPKKCGLSRQKVQECGDWVGGRPSLWWCNETSGKLEVKSKDSLHPNYCCYDFQIPIAQLGVSLYIVSRSRWTKMARLLMQNLRRLAADQPLLPVLSQQSGWRGSRWVYMTQMERKRRTMALQMLLLWWSDECALIL